MSTQKTKNLILSHARTLFASQGYENTVLDQVAKKANLTKGAIYWNFKNKEDLFLKLYTQETEKYLDYLQEQTKNITDPKQIIEVLFKENCRYYLNNQDFCKISHIVFNNKVLKSNEPIKFLMEKIEKEFHTLLSNTFERGVNSGFFSNIPIENLISTFSVIIDGILLQIIFNQPQDKIEKAIETAWGIYISGISTKEDEMKKQKPISMAFQPEG